MKKNWINPQLTNLDVESTKNDDGVAPMFYWPWSPECDKSENYSGDKCPSVLRPCKYYRYGKCAAPVDPIINPSA
ncbi:hypothetical protein [Clostridium sp.]|uniref:hypothetical protein n=1 Tax=Clostridium sp. TaxID=1506 RepID=UPI0032172C66